MALVSNFNVDDKMQRALVWSDERKAFLLRTAKTLFRNDIRVSISSCSAGQWEPRSDPDGRSGCLIIDRVKERRPTYIKIYLDDHGIEDHTFYLEFLKEEKTIASYALTAADWDEDDYSKPIPFDYTADHMEYAIVGPPYDVSKFPLGSPTYNIYAFASQDYKLSFPPMCLDLDTEHETLEDDGPYTEVRMISDVNGGMRYFKDSNTFEYFGNCGNPVSSALNTGGLCIIQTGDKRAHDVVERSFLGRSDRDHGVRHDHPIALTTYEGLDGFFDIEDWISQKDGDEWYPWEAGIANYRSRYPLCTGIGRPSTSITRLTFGALIRCDHDLGPGNVEGDPTTYNWNSIMFVEHKIQSLAEQGSYREIQGGLQYRISQRSGPPGYDEYSCRKLFVHESEGRTWHYYYWQGSDNPQNSITTANGFCFPGLNTYYRDTDFEIQYLSAFLTIR